MLMRKSGLHRDEAEEPYWLWRDSRTSGSGNVNAEMACSSLVMILLPFLYYHFPLLPSFLASSSVALNLSRLPSSAWKLRHGTHKSTDRGQQGWRSQCSVL